MVLAYNFKQLGEEVLCKDHSWMIPIVQRSTSIHDILGGWSHMLAKYLHIQLLGAQGLRTAGVMLLINGAPLLVYANVQSILPDYDGIRIGWDWKGASGLRPCLRCANVFKKNTDLAARLDNCEEITCTDKALLMERTNTEFEEDVDLVTEAGVAYMAGEMTLERFTDIQRSTGQNFNPLGFVADKTLRAHVPPLEVLNQDWVHGILSDGIMGQEMCCFIEADLGVSMADYEAFMKSDLRFPKHYYTKGAHLWRVFDEHRNKPNSEEPVKIKGDASELLGLYALMRHFVELRFQDLPHELDAQRASFIACCDVVDVILEMKNGLEDPRSENGRTRLENAIFTHLRLHIAAYGTQHIKPKHHLNHALAKQFYLKGVFDAFVGERLHLRVKDISERHRNLPHFEAGVLGRVMKQQIGALRDERCLRSSLRGHVVKSSIERWPLATSLQCASLTVHVGDFVCYQLSAGVVSACVADDDNQLFVIVNVFQWRGVVTGHSSLWSPTPLLAVWPANALASPRAWYPRGEDFVMIL